MMAELKRLKECAKDSAAKKEQVMKHKENYELIVFFAFESNLTIIYCL